MAQFSNQHMDRSFLDADIPEIVSKLKADERALLLAGVNWWNTLAIPRLNVPGVRMSDGPNVRAFLPASFRYTWANCELWRRVSAARLTSKLRPRNAFQCVPSTRK